MQRPYRVKINQPSTLQPLHNLHGKVGLAVPDRDETDKYITVYFVEGDLISTKAPKISLELI